MSFIKHRNSAGEQIRPTTAEQTPSIPSNPHFIKILRCTTKAFSSSPGGWVVSGVTQRWLDRLEKIDQFQGGTVSQEDRRSLGLLSTTTAQYAKL